MCQSLGICLAHRAIRSNREQDFTGAPRDVKEPRSRDADARAAGDAQTACMTASRQGEGGHLIALRRVISQPFGSGVGDRECGLPRGRADEAEVSEKDLEGGCESFRRRRGACFQFRSLAHCRPGASRLRSDSHRSALNRH